MNGSQENLCTQGGDMLAYLYNEMPADDRERFEVHLSECGGCIDGFAELSQSRFPVYEWKQIEFDRLPTPRILIPYGEPKASWYEAIRQAFVLNSRFAFGGAAALLMAAVIIGYVLFAGPPDESIAKNIEPSPSPGSTRVNVPPPPPADPDTKTAANTPEKSQKPEVVKASLPVKPPKARKTGTREPVQKKDERVPVYSTAEEEEDDTLRLADIFAELDTSE